MLNVRGDYLRSAAEIIQNGRYNYTIDYMNLFWALEYLSCIPITSAWNVI